MYTIHTYYALKVRYNHEAFQTYPLIYASMTFFGRFRCFRFSVVAVCVSFGCPQKHIARLQQAQHALAIQSSYTAVLQSSSLTSAQLLKQLHCRLAIEWRIRFKLIQATSHPPWPIPRRPFTVSQAHEVHAFICRSLTFSSMAAFHLVIVLFVSAPKIWNSLPPHILQSQTLSSQTSFEDPLLSVSLSCPQRTSQKRPDSLLRFWCYINHLLTHLTVISLCRRVDSTRL